MPSTCSCALLSWVAHIARVCATPVPADEGIMDIKAHSVALVGEPRVLRRDDVTGAATGGRKAGGFAGARRWRWMMYAPLASHAASAAAPLLAKGHLPLNSAGTERH